MSKISSTKYSRDRINILNGEIAVELIYIYSSQTLYANV